METKPKFRAHFREYVERSRKLQFDHLSSTDHGKEMGRFYVDQVLRLITPGLVPDDEYGLEESLVDGKDDCGVDYIYRTEGKVLIVQSKYRRADAKRGP